MYMNCSIYCWFFLDLNCILFSFYVTNTGIGVLISFTSTAYLSTVAYIVIFIPCSFPGRLERVCFELWHNSHNNQFFRDDWRCRKSAILFLVLWRGSISLQSWGNTVAPFRDPQLTFWRYLMTFPYSFPFFVFLFVLACGLLRFPSPYILLLTWHRSIEQRSLDPKIEMGKLRKEDAIRLKLKNGQKAWSGKRKTAGQKTKQIGRLTSQRIRTPPLY